eukprot:TRINITY_DN103_c3_g1_i1.p1 TRINITY_DN103_c3_g1~~TRINITY_DN103_c3_g1_i1.p1  ORF type:complete len:421 (-),score=42.34 TRINITY_DN103_c3_g1_i1:97-1293(-)
MVKNGDLIVTVPSFFKCPISLDVMKSPVSLCTGVTYDRTSIQTWLDHGHNTCPATMQPLLSKDLTPNTTLQSLINTWHSSSRSSHSQALSLLQRLSTAKTGYLLVDPLRTLSDLLSDRETKRILVSSGIVPALASLLPNLRKLEEFEAFVSVLRLILGKDCKEVPEIEAIDADLMSTLLVSVLEKGNLESRIDSAVVLESMIATGDEKNCYRSVAERERSMAEFLRLMGPESEFRAIDAGLSCLTAVAARRRSRPEIVRLGAVPVLTRLLTERSEPSIADKAMRLVETASTCAEGRAAICGGGGECVASVVKRMLKVSPAARERAVVVVWSLCCVFRDRRAEEAVARNGGLAKIVVLLQSDCSPAVKQMAADLVKIFRVNYKSCLLSYETETTHIMPF